MNNKQETNTNSTKCPKCEEDRPTSSFIGRYDKPTKYCQICRDKQKLLDAKRTKTRNWSAEYKNNPELYQKKQQYKKDNIEQQREYEKKSKAKARINAKIAKVNN